MSDRFHAAWAKGVRCGSKVWRAGFRKCKMKSTLLHRWLFLSVAAACMMGCGGALLSWQGATVEENDRISLQYGGPFRGNWQTRDLHIEYEFSTEGKRLNISGTVALDKSLSTGFSILEDFFLSLNFLGSEGKVIATGRLKNFSRRSWVNLDPMGFEKNLVIPEGAVFIAFAYVGRARSGGGMRHSGDASGEVSWDFWNVPRR
jgi:hypothetical protein